MITVVNLWDTATAVASAAAITSDPVSQLRSKGWASLHLIISAGAAPSLDITQTVSRYSDGIYYTPTDSDGTSISAINNTSLTATSWIQFSPVIAPYFKITITGSATNGADTTVRAYIMFQEGMVLK